MVRAVSLIFFACFVAAAAAPMGQQTVTQKNKAFSAEQITIKKGDSIVFKNDDDVTHNVFSNSKGNEFNLKAQAPGAEVPIAFKSEGVVEIRCAFHPKMKMTVTVK